MNFYNQIFCKSWCHQINHFSNKRFAGLQNGTSCYCGTSFGRYGRGECNKRCHSEKQGSSLSICGGEESNTVYSTGVNLPGPPSSLQLTESKETSLSISWEPFDPKSRSRYVVGYHIYVALNRSFDNSVSNRNHTNTLCKYVHF